MSGSDENRLGAAASSAPWLRDPQRYHILGEHGRGGLGRVTRAHDCELGRDIAIKELISRGHASEVRFVREALITARLEHPGIVPVYEAGQWPDGTPFYAMKLVAGRSLRDLLGERATVDQRLGLLHHVIAVADAIAYAHGRNIIHRDLKPGNVIVGDFGETVVIDWGLAKDLSAAEESSVGGGPFRANRDDGLTSTGSVLGTPAYMAPEQGRGEPVDQRADVFAIGAMLWELCSLQRLPPTEPAQRRRVLGRAGIDQDLVAIIDKALAADAERRYPDAGALAADLKAFKAGVRIAARRYSLLAMIAHWARRRRALAVSAAVAVTLAAAGGALYIRNVAAERDRADGSELNARRAFDELTLKHAQLLLATDPSAAVDTLATYHGGDVGSDVGSDVDRARQIRAEAAGRGVAILRAVPHSDNACWAEATANGGVVSLSTDGTIALTARDGSSRIVARGVADLGQSAYAPARHLLAYACDPADVCFYDVARTASVATAPALRGVRAAALAFSPRGTLLAWMSRDSVVKVLDVTDPQSPSVLLTRPVTGGTDVMFLDDDIVAAHTLTGLEFIHIGHIGHIGPLGPSAAADEPFAVPGNSYWDANASAHQFATATERGQAVVFEGAPLRITARAELCHGPVSGLRFIPGRPDLAYACRSGVVGTWRPSDGTVTPRLVLDGHAGPLTVSPSGEYIIAGGGNASVNVLDLTSDLVTSYKGHSFRLISIAPPTPDHPVVVSTDAGGAVRTWPLPARFARLAATVSSPLHRAIFDAGSKRLIATTYDDTLTTFSASAGIGSAGPHDIYNMFLEQSAGGSAFAAYGFDDHIELWSTGAPARTAAINTKQGTVSQLQFAGATDDVIAAGHDGRLVRWTSSGHETLIARIDQPIVAFAQAPATGAIVLGGADGALWRTAAGGRPVALTGAGARVTRMLALPDQRTVYSGYASGDVVAIDTSSWQRTLVLAAGAAVQELASTADGRTVAVATRDAIHLGTTGPGPASGGLAWVAIPIRVRHLALAPDGLLVALGRDGTIWMYSVPRRAWLCLPAGTTDLNRVVITASGSTAAVLDAEGHLIWIDLDAARRVLADAR